MKNQTLKLSKCPSLFGFKEIEDLNKDKYDYFNFSILEGNKEITELILSEGIF